MSNFVPKGIEFVHHDLYGVAMDITKKFISKRDTRPILKYALHTSTGDVLATDSHKAIHLRGIHGFKEEYLVSPKNLMFAKGDYPNLYNVIDIKEHKEAILLNSDQIKLWLQIFKSINNTIKNMKSRINHVVLNLRESNLNVEVQIDSENKYSTVLPYTELIIPDFHQISFSAEFMRDALEAHSKLNSESLTIYFKGKLRPIILDDAKMVKTLILPVRTY